MQWQNSIAGICTDKQLCDKLKDFFQIQLNWTYAQIDANPNNEYWHQVSSNIKTELKFRISEIYFII